MRHWVLAIATAAIAVAQSFSVSGSYRYSQDPPPVVYPNRHNWYNKGVPTNPVNMNPAPAAAPGTCAGMIAGMPASFFRNVPVLSASLNGFLPFPGSGWYDDLSTAPVDPRSDVWTAGAYNAFNQRLKLQSSPEVTEPQSYGNSGGFAVHIVGKDQPKVEVRYEGPWNQDPGPLRIPLNPAVQQSVGTGGGYNVPGDRHLFVIDRDNCVAMDLYGVWYYEGKVRATAGAVFDLFAGDHQRPYFATSSDVAGTPLGPVLLDWDDIDAAAAGRTDAGHALPLAMWNAWGLTGATGMAASHQYTSGCGIGTDASTKPPFGARLRLKPGYDVEAFLAVARSSATYPLSDAGVNRLRALLNNLKKYGFVYTDGSTMPDFWAIRDSRVEYAMFYQMYNNGPKINADFEFAQAGNIYSDCYGKPHPGTTYGAVPSISSFGLSTATGSNSSPVAPGTPVALAWSVTNVPTRLRWVVDGSGGGPGLVDMNPDMSAPSSVIVRPLKTTTYWLMVQSGAEAGRRVSAPVTVYVR